MDVTGPTIPVPKDVLARRSAHEDDLHPAVVNGESNPDSVQDINFQSNTRAVVCSYGRGNDAESNIDDSSYAVCWSSQGEPGFNGEPVCDVSSWLLQPIPTTSNPNVTFNLTSPAAANSTVYCVVRVANRAGTVTHAYSNGLTFSECSSLQYATVTRHCGN